MPSHHAQGKEVDAGSAARRGEGTVFHSHPKWEEQEAASLFWLQRSVFVGLAETDSLWLYFKPTESN